METMTDYKEWLQNENIESAEDMLQVYRPVKDLEPGWQYEMKPARGNTGNYILLGGSANLVLTPLAREAFVKHMDSKFELGVDGQYALDHAMEKND